MIKKLYDIKKEDQALILAIMTRNQWALDYYQATLGSIKELPIYRGDIKRRIKDFEQKAMRYHHAVRDCFTDREAYEQVLDKAEQFHRYTKKMLFYYEQATKRAFDRLKIDNSNELSQLSCAYSCLNITAYVEGIELAKHPEIKSIAYFGNMPVKLSGWSSTRDKLPERPTTMGFMSEVAANIDRSILDAMRHKELDGHIAFTDDEKRTFEITSVRICQALTNYAMIYNLYSGEETTYEEALEQVEEMRKKKQEG